MNFYSPPRTFENMGYSITPAQKEEINDSMGNMSEDPNHYLVGRHVVVTAGNFKNYRGIVKSTLCGGKVLVELEAQLQRQEPFDVRSLHLM